MTKRRSEHKLTRQGVRDLGHTAKTVRHELPEQRPVVCAHLALGRDRFENTRCVDCGAIVDEGEQDTW